MNPGHFRRCSAILLAALLFAGCQPAPPASPASPSAIEHSERAVPATSATTPAAASPARSQTVADPWVLPGRFRADTTVTQLQEWYGKGNVEITQIPMAEGETARGVVLFPNDAARRATLYFLDEKNLAGLSSMQVEERSSRWHYDNGVTIGSTLDDVVKRNGKPLRFYGFGWDYGGVVSEWNGGALAPTAGILRGLRLAPKSADDAASLPMGDGEFSSDDPAFPNMGQRVVVDALQLGLPGADAP